MRFEGLSNLKAIKKAFDKEFGIKKKHPATKFCKGDLLVPKKQKEIDRLPAKHRVQLREGAGNLILKVIGIVKVSAETTDRDFGIGTRVGSLALVLKQVYPKEKDKHNYGWMAFGQLVLVREVTPQQAKKLIALDKLRK